MHFWGYLGVHPDHNFETTTIGQNELARHYQGGQSWSQKQKNTPFQSVMDFRVIHIKSKIPKTSQHFIETKVFLNFFLSDIFKNLDVGNQMSQSYSQNEPLTCPNNAYFSCIIGIYFVALNITLYIIFKKIYKLNSQFN